MATVDVPDWFFEKYSRGTDTPPAMQQIYEASPRDKLYRQFLNLEMADTQQERDEIHGKALESTRRPIPDRILSRLAQRYGEDPDPGKITLTEPDALLARAPTRIAPPMPEGERVFVDQAKFEQILDEAPEEGRPATFKQAFNQARREGKLEFEYKGDLFNTRKKGESEMEWREAVVGTAAPPLLEEVRMPREAPKEMKASPTEVPTKDDRKKTRALLRAAAYRQSIIPSLKKEVEPAFRDFMKRTGVKIAGGKKVDTAQIATELGPALEKIAPAMRKAGIVPEITSGRRDLGAWSLHEVGEAIDLRLKNASPEALKALEEALPGSPTNTSIHGEKGRMWTDGTFEYIIHGTGNNIHLHVERETEQAKQRLVQHMIDKGRGERIPRRGLTRYPNLLSQVEAKMPKVN